MAIKTGNIIPKMTSDNTPSGKVTASANKGSRFSPFCAFDRNNSTYWEVQGDKHWIAYEFSGPKYIYEYSITACRYEREAPKEWTFEGSNDGVEWEVLDSIKESINWSRNEKREFEISKIRLYKMFRINIVEVNDSPHVGISEIEMMEMIFDKKTLILHESTYKYYFNNNWANVGNDRITEQDYITYGMDNISTIPESAWAELEGNVELCYWTDDLYKPEASFNIETEPFTLAEEFDDQTIKIIEYTDNPTQEESIITLETEPFTFYDEVGDSFDVLHYTDDPDKTEAELEINHNYSPWDELDDDFELVTWTMEEETEVQEELKPIFKEKIDGGDLYRTKVDLSKGIVNIK